MMNANAELPGSGLPGSWRSLLMRTFANRRARLVAGLLAGSVLVGLAVIILWHRAAYVATSDARVSAAMIALSGEVSGRITSVSVREGDRVQAGDTLYTLDPIGERTGGRSGPGRRHTLHPG